MRCLELGRTTPLLQRERAGALLLHLRLKWKRMGNAAHKLTAFSVAPVPGAHEGTGKPNGDFSNSCEIKDLSESIQASWVFRKATSVLQPPLSSQHQEQHH